MQCFGDVFEEEKNIVGDIFDDVLQNARHRANDVNHPPLHHIYTVGLDKFQNS